MGDEKLVTFDPICPVCNEMFETVVEQGVFSTVECPACGAELEVTLTIERKK